MALLSNDGLRVLDGVGGLELVFVANGKQFLLDFLQLHQIKLAAFALSERS